MQMHRQREGVRCALPFSDYLRTFFDHFSRRFKVLRRLGYRVCQFRREEVQGGVAEKGMEAAKKMEAPNF